jgi:hypothetical protein
MRLITGVPGFPVNGEYAFNLVTLQHSAARGLAAPNPGCQSGHPAVMESDRFPPWVADVLPGSVHDLTGP